jgi:alpha-L-fucosidase
MYQQHGAPWGDAYAHHLRHFGHPSRFGYKDLIPQWRAERWDPGELMATFQAAGARYFVPVAVHHDNVDLYASSFQPWNSLRLGPKRDVVAAWKQAAQARGLRFGVSSHCDRTWEWLSLAFRADTDGPWQGIPYDGRLTREDGRGQWWEGLDPADLYTRPHSPAEPPDTAYCAGWLQRTLELIERYQPDLLYFDGPLPIVCAGEACRQDRARLERYGLEVAAHFYNQNQLWHGGALEAVLNVKNWEPGSVPDAGAVVLDIEKGVSGELKVQPWQTDTSLDPQWFYSASPLAFSSPALIHTLVDIVSKNGNLLLNVSLTAEGELPAEQRSVLAEIGAWLSVHGEAIYGSRPYRIFGEGPTEVPGGDFSERNLPFTWRDVRYTAKPGRIYATVLGDPQGNPVRLPALSSEPVARVSLLGAGPLPWRREDSGLTVDLGRFSPGPAFTLRLDLAGA